MKRVWMLLAAGLLLMGGSAVRAEEKDEGGTPGTMNLAAVHTEEKDEGKTPGTMNLAPVREAAAPTPARTCCPAAACEKQGCGHQRSFGDWLCYKPVKSHCACHCNISPCFPPLHMWFLDMCQGGGCGASCSKQHLTVTKPACAGGGCAAAHEE
jgi:hypothetical protein